MCFEQLEGKSRNTYKMCPQRERHGHAVHKYVSVAWQALSLVNTYVSVAVKGLKRYMRSIVLLEEHSLQTQRKKKKNELAIFPRILASLWAFQPNKTLQILLIKTLVSKEATIQISVTQSFFSATVRWQSFLDTGTEQTFVFMFKFTL